MAQMVLTFSFIGGTFIVTIKDRSSFVSLQCGINPALFRGVVYEQMIQLLSLPA